MRCSRPPDRLVPCLELCAVPIWQSTDEPISVRQAGRFNHLGLRGVTSKTDRLSDGAGKNGGALGNQGDLTAQLTGPKTAEIEAIEQDPTVLSCVEPQKHGEQRALASTRRAHIAITVPLNLEMS